MHYKKKKKKKLKLMNQKINLAPKNLKKLIQS